MHEDHPIPPDVPDVYYTHIEDLVAGETDGSGTCTLLENLKAEGYRMADKLEGADYRHCHMALTSLAHYHRLPRLDDECGEKMEGSSNWRIIASSVLCKVSSRRENNVRLGNRQNHFRLFRVDRKFLTRNRKT